MVKGAINTALPGTLHVVGELSNVSQPAGGHIYFTLKDKTSELRCVMWRSDAANLKFRLADGQEVVATGSLDVYEPRGQYQFYVRRLEPRGVGALELAFQQLKEKLEKEGLFDPGRKRPLPRFPRRIAVVTSPTGAAIRDILQTIARRYPLVEVLVFGVRVQGDEAAPEIADAIRRINASRDALGGVDVMIVGRGGGSLEDLWAFNDESVARAIHESEIRVISAVGHEVDFTIADFVADVRAATPTAAAELVVPVLTDVVGEIDDLGRHLRRSLGRVLDAARSRIAVIEKCEWFRDPVGRVRHRQQQIDEVRGRAALAMTRRLARLRGTVHHAEVRLFRARPEAVLARRRELLSRAEHRLRWAQRGLTLRGERRVSALAVMLHRVSPTRQADQARIILGQLAAQLVRSAARMRADRRWTLSALETRLRAGSHESILNRGFTITRHVPGRRIIRKARDVREGDGVETETFQGTFVSRVIDTNQGDLFGDDATGETSPSRKPPAPPLDLPGQ
jgi:exodeoxyribonuclease VII large subunit